MPKENGKGQKTGFFREFWPRHQRTQERDSNPHPQRESSQLRSGSHEAQARQEGRVDVEDSEAGRGGPDASPDGEKVVENDGQGRSGLDEDADGKEIGQKSGAEALPNREREAAAEDENGQEIRNAPKNVSTFPNFANLKNKILQNDSFENIFVDYIQIEPFLLASAPSK